MPLHMSILFLISSEGYYGAETMVVTLAQQLALKGFDCALGVFSNSQSPHTEVGEQARRHGLPVEIVPCKGKWDGRTVRHLRKLLTARNISIVHAHGYKADLYAYAAAWPSRAALVATSHNWTSSLLKMRAYAALDRLVLGRFDEVIVVSDVVGDTLRRWGVAANKLSTISNGVNVDQFQGAAATLRNEILAEGSALVGFVGRLVPEKGGEQLLRAAKQVLAVLPNTRFVLVGDGPARQEWEDLSSQLEITAHVWFAGRREDIAGVYASLDIVVLPSLLEAQPMCLLEAMAAEKPVIATRVGAVSKVINSGETGLLLPPGDVDGLAGAIVRLLKDPELARRLAQKGSAHVARHFSAEAMAWEYIARYQHALGRRGTPFQGQTKWETN
jgi:glycosyltransferase involved in cell wall biosynthesis